MAIIDLDKEPLIPVEGWAIHVHSPQGQLSWDVSKVQLTAGGTDRFALSTASDMERLAMVSGDCIGYNANLWHHLLLNQHDIPEEWKGRRIFFSGTIYINSVKKLYMVYLWWDAANSRWGWDYLRLDTLLPDVVGVDKFAAIPR